jgi:hypothetical protein
VRRVIVESPYAGDIAANIAYARAAVRDCVLRGEAPIASHLLFTQEGILDDGRPDERRMGIAAGLAWLAVADATVVYNDHGVSKGMKQGIISACAALVTVEYRSLPAFAAVPFSGDAA